jgi:flagella basal body P-ring formation protein FlgA
MIARALIIALAIAATAPATAAADDAPEVSIATAIATQLAPSLSDDLAIGEVHVPRSLADKTVAPGELAVEPPRKIAAGRKSVKITLDGKAFFVPVTFAALGPAVVANRELAAGDVITAADVSLGRAATTAGAPTSTDAAIGATVTRAIPAGGPVAKDSIAMPAPTPRGTAVTVVATRGAVKVKIDGVLEAAARPGESVLVRLSTTHATARGTFAAPSTVIVGVDP